MAYDPSRGVSPAAACVIRKILVAAATAAGRRVLRKVTGSSIRVPECSPASYRSIARGSRVSRFPAARPWTSPALGGKMSTGFGGLAMTPKKADAPGQGLFRSDEPSTRDDLDRGTYVNALGRLILGCPTPIVVGIYGGWGVGKSSLMLQIQKAVEGDGVKTVWFEPWLHQFDDNPVIALLQKMAVDFDKETVEEVKSTLIKIALALGSSVTKRALGLSFKDFETIEQRVEGELFNVRSTRIRLREEIERLIDNVSGRSKRIVFFIDDLDRCLPKHMIRVLEALKLYLDIEGCVYVLGVDDDVVRKGIAQEYQALDIDDRNYLEKIIQIPFRIPPIPGETAEPYIAGLLPMEARDIAEYLAPALGENPRKVKRFVNNFVLNLELAQPLQKEEGSNWIDVTAALLLVQHRRILLWNKIAANPPYYDELCRQAQAAHSERTKAEAEERTQQVADEILRDDTVLQRVLDRVGPARGIKIEALVSMSGVVGASVRDKRALAIEPEMVPIEPGTFIMGSEDEDSEKPPHEVTIGYRFALGKYPVTFAEYDAFCEATGREKPDDNGWGRERRPAINVSWQDATAYVEWLSEATGKPYRLPTEAEWEYCCRAGTTTEYSCGDEITEKDANVGGQVHWTTEVGAYTANPWGLHDMHGNVWEFVEDVWHENYKGAPDDGSAWTEGGDQSSRVLRGGSWDKRRDYARSANRIRFLVGLRSYAFSFRVARTL
jgi:formylglycine-generating enzyme required for sulfatase activity